jgi:hypothetical protein
MIALSLLFWALVPHQPPPAPPPLEEAICHRLRRYYDHALFDYEDRLLSATEKRGWPGPATDRDLVRLLLDRCAATPGVYPTLYGACTTGEHHWLIEAIGAPSTGPDPCDALLVRGVSAVPCSSVNLAALLARRVVLPALPPLGWSRQLLHRSPLPEAQLALYDDDTVRIPIADWRRKPDWVGSYLEMRGLAWPEGTAPEQCVVRDEPGPLADAASAARKLPPAVRRRVAEASLRLSAFFLDLGAPRRAFASRLRAWLLAPAGSAIERSARRAASEVACVASAGQAEPALLDEAMALLRAQGRSAKLECRR